MGILSRKTWFIVLLLGVALSSCSRSSSTGGDETAGNGTGDRPGEEGEGVPGYLTYFIDTSTESKTLVSGSGNETDPIRIELAAGTTSVIAFVAVDSFTTTISCVGQPSWTTLNDAANLITLAPPAELASGEFTFTCNDGPDRTWYVIADVKGGSDGTEFLGTNNLALTFGGSIHSNSASVSIGGDLSGDVTGFTVYVSVRDSVSNNCLNDNKTAFDATCPSYHAITAAANWSLIVGDSVMTHRRDYEVSSYAQSPTAQSATLTQSFLYKIQVGATVYTHVYDQGSNDDENARAIAVDNANDVFYVIGQAENAVAGSSGDDYQVKKYNFDGTEVLSGNWGTGLLYSPHTASARNDYPKQLVYDSTNDVVISAGNVHQNASYRGESVNQFTAAGSMGWEVRLTSGYDSQENSVAVYGGNVYSCGSRNNFLNGTSSQDFYMKKISLAGVEDTVTGNWPYSGFQTGTNDDRCHDIHVDASGIYTLGHRDALQTLVVSHFDFDANREQAWSDIEIAEGGIPAQQGFWRMIRQGNYLYLTGYGQNLVTGGGNDYDGFVRKIDITTGSEVTTGNWPIYLDSGNGNDRFAAIAWHPYAERIIVGGFGNLVSVGVSDDDHWIDAYDENGVKDTSLSFVFNSSRDGEDRIDDIKVDEDGDIIVAGKVTNEASASSAEDWIIRVISGPGPQ